MSAEELLVEQTPPFDFDELFDADYLHFYEPMLNDERSEATVELLWELLELQPGMTVLDLACGHGRIANRLAAGGCQVTGLDASTVFLDRARADAEAAGVTVDYLHGDMRELPFADASFDRIVCVFTAFGYFDDEGNRSVLREAARVLRAGGMFYADQHHLLSLVRNWQEEFSLRRGDDWMIDQHDYDAETGRTLNERTILRHGRSRTLRYFVRTLTGPEWRAWLHEAGFSAAALYGEGGSDLTMDSRRLIAVGRR
jgi:SAM-dependent methyltransferase